MKKKEKRTKVVVWPHSASTPCEWDGEYTIEETGCLVVSDPEGTVLTTYSPAGWDQVRLAPVEEPPPAA